MDQNDQNMSGNDLLLYINASQTERTVTTEIHMTFWRYTDVVGVQSVINPSSSMAVYWN